MLVLDETGFLKKGRHSVGVARQYSGTAGRIENCQVGVFLGYASPNGHALIDRRLYLPKDWIEDAERRRRRLGVPDDVTFATKPKIGVSMVAAAIEAGVPCAWVLGDSVYGSDKTLRVMLESHDKPYVLSVRGNERLMMGDFRTHTAEDLAAGLSADEWWRLPAGQGSKGPRLYDWARLRLFRLQSPPWDHWLLIRRSIADPTDMAFYVTFGPDVTELKELAAVAGLRWTIEECFQSAKGETGLDHCEARSWHGWHRHMTLSMFALAFLAGLRARLKEAQIDARLWQSEQKESIRRCLKECVILVAISVQELRRLFIHLRSRRPPDLISSGIGRSGDAITKREAKRAHYRKRAQSITTVGKDLTRRRTQTDPRGLPP